MTGFWKAYGLGTVAAFVALAFLAYAGNVAAAVALVVGAGLAIAAGPRTAGRVLGVLAALATPFVLAGLTALLIMTSSAWF